MTQKQAPQDLLAKIEAGEMKPHQVFNAFDTPCQDFALQQRAEDAKNAYRGSLDAAKALHEAVLPGFHWSIDSEAGSACVFDNLMDIAEVGEGEDPARSWLVAIIKALIAEAEHKTP